jgi:lysyl-tRNA synthetase class 1
MHWVDSTVKNQEGPQIVSTGISPSGPIHLGNLREIITGDLLFRGCRDKGLKSELIYLADDMDPLRKKYPFLSDEYEAQVGKPLRHIPAPDGKGLYSDYFLNPFIKSASELGIFPRIIKAGDLYRDGQMGEVIRIAIQNIDKIRNLIETISGRELEKEWFPYNPICSSCGRINSTRGYELKGDLVSYTCKCGHTGESNIFKEEGKLPWRIEWPAKWKVLGVTIEPFGKDHGTVGGSYDTGKAIAENIYGYPAPLPLMFERILLKGKGAMHSSTGNVIPASEILSFCPPEIVRFLMSRVPSTRHIEFDPGMGFLSLMDEYQRIVKDQKPEDSRIVELSSPFGFDKQEVIDYRHIATLVQIYDDPKKILSIIKSTGVETSLEEVSKTMQLAKHWIVTYAPESFKFSILPKNQPVKISEEERAVISDFISWAQLPDTQWDATSIHNAIHSIIKEHGIEPADGFRIFYSILIGKERGPRLGFFLSAMDKGALLERLKFV